MLGLGLGTKIQVFIWTFFSYASIHSLRTTYSYSKQAIADALHTPKSSLGIIDTCMLLCLGVGFLYHALSPTKQPKRNLVIGMFVCTFTYALVPFVQNFILAAFLIGINGFAQSFTWPNLLVIVNTKWDKTRDSTELGFWTTNANIGNILGFVLCESIHSLNINWKMQMLLAAAFTFVIAVVTYFRVDQIDNRIPAKSGQEQQNNENQNDDNIENNKELNIVSVLKQPAVLMVAGNLSFIKSIIYGIMLWLPLYFQSIGLTAYSTYIPIAYDISCVAGSSLLGYLFTKVSSKGTLLAPLMALLMVCFYLLKYCQISVLGYFLIISIIGPCLGGAFNTIVGLSTLQLTKDIPPEKQLSSLGMYSAVTMALANFVTALTQMLIGFVAGKDQQMIFGIFMVYSLIAFVGFLLQIYSQWKEKQNSKKIE